MMGVIIKLFHREKLKGIGPDSTLIEELQGIAMTEGSNQVTSLANLRYIVGSLCNDKELYSGSPGPHCKNPHVCANTS